MPRTRYPKGEVLLLLAALAGLGAPAHADVLERSPDGAVHVRARDQGSSMIPTGGEQVGDMQLPPEAMTIIAGSPAPAAYAEAVEQIAASNQISATLLEAVVWQESRWRPGALSPKGAIGLAQLMPGTARDLGVDPRNPHGNLAGGARYLRQQLDRFDGDLERALAAYNAGPGRVLRARGVPRIPETQSYVRAVLDRLSGTSAKQGRRP